MRWLVTLILVVGIIPATAGSAAGANRPATLKMTTGRVSALDLSRITVNHMTCSLASSKIAETAQSFAVGENVAIGCVANALHTIALQPITSGPTHPDSIVASIAPASANDGRSTTNHGGSTITWNSGSTAARSATGTVSASGPITAIDATGITIGDETCPFVVPGSPPNGATAASFLLKDLQVGEVAQMNCTVFSNDQSSGRITTG